MYYPLVIYDFAIENDPFIVDLPIKDGESFHSHVGLPEDIVSIDAKITIFTINQR